MKLLLYSWAGLGNLGDDWLISTAAELLGDHEVTLLLEPPADTDRLPDLPVLRWPGVRSPAAVREFRHATSGMDALVLAGGGWFAADQGLRTPLRWAWRLRAAALPVHALGVGAGPFTTRSGRAASRLAAARVRQPWTVRSERDREALGSVGVSRAEVYTDVTFAGGLEAPPAGPRTGVVAALARPGEHWGLADVHRYRRAVVARTRELADGEPTTFLSFQTGTPDESDEGFWGEHFDQVTVPATVAEAAQVLGRSRVAVTGRFHAALMAARTGTPQISVSYHHKFRALSPLGIPVVDISDVDEALPTPAAGDCTTDLARGAALAERARGLLTAPSLPGPSR